MEIQEAYKQKMLAQLKEWGVQIDLLEAKIGISSADIGVKRAKLLYELRAKQHVASEKMKELEKASGEAWVQIKFTADQIWDDLKAGITETHSKFN